MSWLVYCTQWLQLVLSLFKWFLSWLAHMTVTEKVLATQRKGDHAWVLALRTLAAVSCCSVCSDMLNCRYCQGQLHGLWSRCTLGGRHVRRLGLKTFAITNVCQQVLACVFSSKAVMSAGCFIFHLRPKRKDWLKEERLTLIFPLSLSNRL